MDFRSVTGVTIPAGNVNKISIGSVVYWKKSNNKYKIMKDGVQVDKLTMAELVSKVQNGDAQTDYGVGAQIVVPYHDPFDDNDYKLPFNFGTFTCYGEGKLGLQSHYAVPSVPQVYGKTSGYNYNSVWENSYTYTWLNNTRTYDDTTFVSVWETDKSFLSCIPKDFAEAMNSLQHGNYDTDFTAEYGENGGKCKVFLLGLEGSCASMEKYYPFGVQNTDRYYDFKLFYGDGGIWEYWQSKIGSPQAFHANNLAERIVQGLNNKAVRIILPNYYYDNSGLGYYYMTGFNQYGRFDTARANDTQYYLPACVIG